MQARVQCIGLPDRDIAKIASDDLLLCHLCEPLLPLEPHNAAAASDPFGQQVEDAQRPAADVDCTPARLDSNLIEQPLRRRLEAFRLRP